MTAANRNNLVRLTLPKPRRFTADDPCPICGGDQTQERGSGGRCGGFWLGPKVAFCTKISDGGEWRESSQAYRHEILRKSAATKPNARQPGGSAATPKGKVVAVYRYHDERGKLLYEVVRYEPKNFRQRRPKSTGGYVWSTKGVRRVPHRLPETLEAIRKGKTVYITEGEKDADVLRQHGLAATTNPGGAGKWTDEHCALLRGAKRVVLWPDWDYPGQRHARQVVSSLARCCPDAKVKVIRAADGLKDASDHYAAGLGLKDAVAVNLQRGLPRPDIAVGARQLRDVVDEVVRTLRAANDPPFLYGRGGSVVRIRVDEDDRSVIEELDAHGMADRMTVVADFTDGRSPAFPSLRLARAVLAWPELPFPSLVGITEIPVLRPDGTILDRAGYDPATRLVYRPTLGRDALRIPEAPTNEEVRTALALLDELVCDFPFLDGASKTTVRALLLTVVMRPAIEGPVPLFLFSAPQPGSGKTLLASCGSTVATGRDAASQSAPRDGGDEMRKRITAVLLRGTRFALIDNIEGKFASDALAAAVTTSVWEDRQLTLSKQLSLPAKTIWVLTGNNITLSGDLVRRAVPCHLDAKTDQPWKRDGFRHPELLRWVRESRGRLVQALLTLARAWVGAGCPGPAEGTPQLGSFEEWRAKVGGVLAVAGVPGFLAGLDSFYGQADEEAAEWVAFLAAWHDVFAERPVGVQEIVKAVTESIGGQMGFNVKGSKFKPALREAVPTDLAEDLGRDEGRFAKRLGRAFASVANRRFTAGEGATLRVERVETSGNKSNLWRAVRESTVTKG